MKRRRLKAELAEHAEAITHAVAMMENAVMDAPAGEVTDAERRALRPELARLSTLADALLEHVSALGDPVHLAAWRSVTPRRS